MDAHARAARRRQRRAASRARRDLRVVRAGGRGLACRRASARRRATGRAASRLGVRALAGSGARARQRAAARRERAGIDADLARVVVEADLGEPRQLRRQVRAGGGCGASAAAARRRPPAAAAGAAGPAAAPMDCADPPPANRTRRFTSTSPVAMQELWSSASYEPHLLSLPFALAPAAMLDRDRVRRGDARRAGAARLAARALLCAPAVRDRDDAVAVDHARRRWPSSCSASPPASIPMAAATRHRVPARADPAARGTTAGSCGSCVANAAIWIVRRQHDRRRRSAACSGCRRVLVPERRAVRVARADPHAR